MQIQSALNTDVVSTNKPSSLYDVKNLNSVNTINSVNTSNVIPIIPLSSITNNYNSASYDSSYTPNISHDYHNSHEYPIIWEIRTYMTLIIMLSIMCVLSISWAFMQSTAYSIVGVIPALIYGIYLWAKLEHSFSKQKIENHK